MRWVLIFFILMMPFLMGGCHNDTGITPEHAAAHLGEAATVEGTVSFVSVSKKGNIFLNFGGKYPSQIFTAYVPAGTGLDFDDLKLLEGKIVRVTGEIINYKGKPEIVINKRSQIEP